MKFFVVALSLVASVLAQSIEIESPTTGQTVPAGQNITVQVNKPVSILVSFVKMPLN